MNFKGKLIYKIILPFQTFVVKVTQSQSAHNIDNMLWDLVVYTMEVYVNGRIIL